MWNSQEKIKSATPHEENCMAWLIEYGKTVFSKLLWKFFLSVSGKQVSKLLVFLSQIFRYFPAFSVVISVEYLVPFILGKCLVDF